jgi:hypothetical protein
LDDLKAILRTHISAGEITEKPSQEDGFQEVRRRKRHNTTEAAPTCKKPVTTGASAPVSTDPKEIPTRNFFAPLRAAKMDTDAVGSEASSSEATSPGKRGRPPPHYLNVCSKPYSAAETTERCCK